MNRVKADRQNTNPLTMKLNGTLDAAVQGGVANFDVSGNIHVCIWVCFCVYMCTTVFMCMCTCACVHVHVYNCVHVIM